jgi:hypothetical protein
MGPLLSVFVSELAAPASATRWSPWWGRHVVLATGGMTPYFQHFTAFYLRFSFAESD